MSSVPSWNLSGPHAFVSFMEKFLDSSSRVEKPCLHKVKLTTVEDDITRWIDFMARPELEHLDFECKPVVSGTLMPLRLYTCCPKLRHLRLHGVFVGSTSLESSVSLPCLKTMRLENNSLYCVFLQDLSRSLFWGEQTRFTAVPQCLLSSLEFVEIASTFGGLPAEMKLVRYFAENSVVLKKLSLRLKSTMDEQDSVALRDLLLALPTLSSACEIVVC
ncbi:hypothetical protein DY000_02036815 [Brassica cretica]|uniref:FBD domain-containing protein n=1 Tax=Brassica cretica TaxID=69181 RepID=A0ABQ7B9U5_BRACR|nr:hypothetical protein DY000_02036815 [Brassica cretica]